MAKRLSFYDVKAKKKFNSQSYKVVTKNVRGSKKKYAVAKSPYNDFEAWRVLPKDF